MSLLGTIGGLITGAAPIIGGALAGPLGVVGGSVAGSLIGGAGKYMSNEDAINEEKEMIAYKSQLEQANWEKRFQMQNEYNDPSAMRKRLEMAGYNPQLAVGNFSGNMAANPSAGTPAGGLAKYMNAMEQSAAQMQLQAQRQQMEIERQRIQNETRVAESEVAKNEAQAGDFAETKRGKAIINDREEEGRPYWKQNAYLANQILGSEAYEKNSNAAWAPMMSQGDYAIKEQTIASIFNEIDLQKKHYKLAEQLNHQQIENLKATFGYIMSQKKSLDIENSWKDAALFWELLNAVLEAKTRRETIKSYQLDNIMKQFDVDNLTAREIRDWIESITGSIGNVVGASGVAAGGRAALKRAGTLAPTKTRQRTTHYNSSGRPTGSTITDYRYELGGGYGY